MVGDGGYFGRAGNSWKGTLLGTGGGSQVVDVLRRSFLAFIGCLTCCSSTHSTQPAEVGLQKPLVPSEVTPFLWALPSFQNTPGPFPVCTLSWVEGRPGWARLGWLCGAELLRRMRTIWAADGWPLASIAHSDDCFTLRPHLAEKSSEELRSTSRFTSIRI